MLHLRRLPPGELIVERIRYLKKKESFYRFLLHFRFSLIQIELFFTLRFAQHIRVAVRCGVRTVYGAYLWKSFLFYLYSYIASKYVRSYKPIARFTSHIRRTPNWTEDELRTPCSPNFPRPVNNTGLLTMSYQHTNIALICTSTWLEQAINRSVAKPAHIWRSDAQRNRKFSCV